MDYKRLFDPATSGGTAEPEEPGAIAYAWSTHQAHSDVYVFSPRVILAVNVALAARRPLLVAGEPGAGKTRLAEAAARVLAWPYYASTVTSRTQATDLLWTFDALRRFHHASTPSQTELLPDRAYVEPGPLWWGYDPATAARRGAVSEAKVPAALDPAPKMAGEGAVVLVDEIDKADPDVPNDLLEPFDVRRFTIKETRDEIQAQRDVLLVLTTNGERELPPAFLRRCIVLNLEPPSEAWFGRVGLRHFPQEAALVKQVASAVEQQRTRMPAGRRKPSTAEFLDAVRACSGLGLTPEGAPWDDVVELVLSKYRDPNQKQPAEKKLG